MRGSASEIITMYHKLIGFSMVPPYYALGFWAGSSAYETQEEVEDMLNTYQSLYIPVEGVMIDDYYLPNEVFTVNDVNFEDFKGFTDGLNANHQHVVVGINSGVANDPSYAYYKSLTDAQCTIFSSMTTEALVAMQSRDVVIPDQFCPKINAFYDDALKNLDSLTHFEGVWLQNN
jgi:alpha-glucosidase (family GH31 glycosyl hydrolase)